MREGTECSKNRSTGYRGAGKRSHSETGLLLYVRRITVWEVSTEQRETREAGTHTEVWSCLSKQLQKDLEHLEQIYAKQEQYREQLTWNRSIIEK
jgi:hypothetical protein